VIATITAAGTSAKPETKMKPKPSRMSIRALIDGTGAEIGELRKQQRADDDHAADEAGSEEADEDDDEAADQGHDSNANSAVIARSSRQNCVAILRRCDEAIQAAAAESFWIASLRSQ